MKLTADEKRIIEKLRAIDNASLTKRVADFIEVAQKTIDMTERLEAAETENVIRLSEKRR
ncbi:hypothetical protein [Terasakiella sp. SH-1]|uniref:hypothetical protein n=1 Tax=Terasakiella sp. SH-1 TaxID=2560057 RepID=UPI0010740CC0|nr:hypothetical protein [Terasakiella sp. SH-1]